MSADRLIRKPIGGPDRGETPVIPEPTVEAAPAYPLLTTPAESLIAKSMKPPVSVDRGYVPDKYGQNVKPYDQAPRDQLRLDLRGNQKLGGTSDLPVLRTPIIESPKTSNIPTPLPQTRRTAAA